jgi:anti-sigma regulatory factor (Ser/Thr protein kinase)
MRRVPAGAGGQLAVKPKRKKAPAKPDSTRPRSYDFELRSRLSELETLCRELQAVGRSLKLSKKCLFEINLILDELFTNIISYGFPDQNEHGIHVRITANGETLTIVVIDDGVPFDPIEQGEPPIPCDVEHCRIGGLGIHLIKRLVDDACYCRSGDQNILTLKKKIEKT